MSKSRLSILIITGCIALASILCSPKKHGLIDEFNPYFALGLWVISSLLCLFQFLLLRAHQLSRRQLSRKRVFQLAEQQKHLAIFHYTPIVKVMGNYFIKAVLPLYIYRASSDSHNVVASIGLAFGFGMLFFNTRLMFKSIVNDRETQLRRYLMFSNTKHFALSRMLFEMFRRIIYIVISMSFISFTLERLEWTSFGSLKVGEIRILTHIAGNLAGLSVGTDPLIYDSWPSQLWQIFRTLFAIVMAGVFINVLLNTLMQLGEKPKRKPTKVFVSDVEDIGAGIELALQAVTGCRFEFSIEGESVLGTVKGGLSKANLQHQLEQVFEVKWEKTLLVETMTNRQIYEAISKKLHEPRPRKSVKGSKNSCAK